VQSGVVIALSTVAFALGIYTTVTAWLTPGASTGTPQRAISIIWHAVQALVECLITFFLSRVLLKSRSGLRKSDWIVNHLVRGAIQTGCLATLWAIASSITWFFLPHVMAFRIFDITSGTVYTQAIFDTLLSRIRMRQRLNHPTTHLELGSQGGQGISSKLSGRLGLTASSSRVLTAASPPFSTSESGKLSRFAGKDVSTIELANFTAVE